MRLYEFKITFPEGAVVTVYAGSIKAAVILAKAERIKAGLQWEKIKKVDKVKVRAAAI